MKPIKKVLKPAMWLSFFIAIYCYCRYFLSYNYFFVEQFTFFRFSREYAEETLKQPGGLGNYLADFLTQFYLVPGAGPFITAVLSVSLIILLDLCWKKISRGVYVPVLSALPALTLIWLEIDCNYFLSGTVSLILAVGLFYTYMKTACLITFNVRLLLLIILSWPINFLLGPASLLMVILCILYELRWNDKHSLTSLLALPLACLSPIIFYFMEMGGELSAQMLPKGYYWNHLPTPMLCYYPWALVLLNIIMAKLCSTGNSKVDTIKTPFLIRYSYSFIIILLQLFTIVGIMYWGLKEYSQPKNYEAKSLDYYTRIKDWQSVLDNEYLRASENFMHTCYQNLALSSLNMMGDKMFSFPQIGLSGVAINWNKTVNSSILLSDVYWQSGDIALAQEMAFEGMIASRSGVNPRLLMRLVQTNLVGGNYSVAEKYISKLEETYSYAAQARQYRSLLYNDEAVLNDSELGPRRLGMLGTKGLTNTQSFIDNLQQIMQQNPEMIPAFHYFGGMCLLVKDMASFKAFIDRSHNLPALSKMPIHFQEAIVLIYENEKENWDKYGVTSSVKQRYDQYRELFLENRGTPLLSQKMARAFGNTYWFYYMFKK